MSVNLLTELIGMIESGNNPNQGFQPGSGTIGGQYQQSYGFQQQYGGNTSGQTNLDPAYQLGVLNNYLSSAIAANPNISVGDLYAGYNLNTGVAGDPSLGFGMLPGNVQANVNGAAAALGIDLNSPAASIYDLGSSAIASGPDVAEGYGTGLLGELEGAITGSAPSTEGFVGGAAASAGATAAESDSGGGGGGLFGGLSGLFGGGGGGSGEEVSLAPGLAAGVGDWISSLGESIVQGFNSATAGFLGGVTNWVTRAFIVLVALVLIGVAVAALLFKATPSDVKKAALAAA